MTMDSNAVSGRLLHQSWINSVVGFSSQGWVRKGTITLFDQGIVSATNFLTGVIVARACSPEEFGSYSLGWSIVLIATCLQNSLVSSPYTLHSTRLDSGGSKYYAGSTLAIQLGLSALIALSLAIGGISLYITAGATRLTSIVCVLAVVISILLLREFFRRILFAHLNMRAALRLDIFLCIFQVGTLLILARFDRLSAISTLIVISIGGGLAVIFCMFSMRHSFLVQYGRIKRDLRTSFRLGKWILASSMVILINIEIYRWLLTAFYGLTEVGKYAACWSIVAILNPLKLGVGNFFEPMAARGYTSGPSEFSRIIVVAVMFLATSVGFICLAIAASGDYLLGFVFGDAYTGNGSLLVVLSAFMFVSTLGSVATHALRAMERADLDFKIGLIVIGITLSIGVFFTMNHGALGAALGLVVGGLCGLLLRFLVLTRFMFLMHDTSKIMQRV
ncbi:lipopolysaccharide biosynthesis protein [Planctomycetota bacterium]